MNASTSHETPVDSPSLRNSSGSSHAASNGSAFVTGAARGIGLAVARAFAGSGRAVALSDVSSARDQLDAEVARLRGSGYRATAIVADVRNQNQLDDAFSEAEDEFGEISTVVANAGLGIAKPFWKLDEDEWMSSVDITLNGAWRTAKAAAPRLISSANESSHSSIVFIGSTSGERPNYGFASYVAAKHGLIGLMRAVALELAPYRIRSNAVLLGTVDTPGTNSQEQWRRTTQLEAPSRSEYLRAINRMHALEGAAPLRADTVAESVVWLASDAARYTTGAALPVDAGRLVLPPLRDLDGIR